MRPRKSDGMMTRAKGFSLMELLVVVMIMAILATIGIPGYFKTMEMSKARDAQAMVNMIGKAHQMYALDNNDIWEGSTSALSASHPLVQKRYVGANDWGNLNYNFYSCPPTGGGATCCTASPSVTRPVACGTRRNGSGTYASWGYAVGESGAMVTRGGSPAP